MKQIIPLPHHWQICRRLERCRVINSDQEPKARTTFHMFHDQRNVTFHIQSESSEEPELEHVTITKPVE